MKFLGTNELHGIDSAFPNKSRGQVVGEFGGHPIPQGRMRKGRGIRDKVGMAAIKKTTHLEMNRKVRLGALHGEG